MNNKYLAAIVAGLVLSHSSVALAGPGKISGPHVTKGETEIVNVTKFGFDYDSDSYELENELEYEYGLTDRLKLEAEVEHKKVNGEETITDKVAVAARYEIFEPGEALIDTAIELGYDYSTDGDADKVGLGFLFEKEVGEIEIKSNVDFAHEVGEDAADGVEFETAFGFYKDLEESELEVGIEYFADFGNLRTQSGYSSQSHSIGPVIEKEFEIDGAELEVQFGYFQGISRGADDGTAKLVLEYVF